MPTLIAWQHCSSTKLPVGLDKGKDALLFWAARLCNASLLLGHFRRKAEGVISVFVRKHGCHTGRGSTYMWGSHLAFCAHFALTRQPDLVARWVTCNEPLGLLFFLCSCPTLGRFHMKVFHAKICQALSLSNV